MSGKQLQLPAYRAFNSDGVPVANAVAYLYLSGGTTPALFYSDAALTISLGSSITANSAGRFAPIPYGNPTIAYRLKILDPEGATLDDIDPFYFGDNLDEALIFAISDETTALTTGTAKVTFRMPFGFVITGVRASVNTAPTGATLIVDINEAGVSILSTKLSIDATEKTSTTAASAAVLSDTSIADDAEITFDIDQIGSTIAGAGLKVTLIGGRS